MREWVTDSDADLQRDRIPHFVQAYFSERATVIGRKKDVVMTFVIILNAIEIGISADSSDWEGRLLIDGVFAIIFF